MIRSVQVSIISFILCLCSSPAAAQVTPGTVFDVLSILSQETENETVGTTDKTWLCYSCCLDGGQCELLNPPTEVTHPTDPDDDHDNPKFACTVNGTPGHLTQCDEKDSGGEGSGGESGEEEDDDKPFDEPVDEEEVPEVSSCDIVSIAYCGRSWCTNCPPVKKQAEDFKNRFKHPKCVKITIESPGHRLPETSGPCKGVTSFPTVVITRKDGAREVVGGGWPGDTISEGTTNCCSKGMCWCPEDADGNNIDGPRVCMPWGEWNDKLDDYVEEHGNDVNPGLIIDSTDTCDVDAHCSALDEMYPCKKKETEPTACNELRKKDLGIACEQIA